jgi:hypothetical protein
VKKSDSIQFLPKKDLFRVDEVAAFFGVCKRTPYNWIEQWKDAGRVDLFITLPTGGVRIPRTTIIMMLDHSTLSEDLTS